MVCQGEHQAKILLVNEDRGDATYYKSVFQKPGFRIHATESYDEAISWLTSDQFDLVIVDEGSPRFEAKRILQKAIEIDRRLPVLVLTRHLDMGCYLEAMQLGAVDYLEEPLKPEEMIRVVKAHLNFSSLAHAKTGAESRGGI